MAVVARNAYKGYTYQEYIHLFFTALMDTEKKIAEIEAEIISEHNFDDLYILFKDQTKYFVQIKNYPQTELSDISISDDEITIGTNKSKLTQSYNITPSMSRKGNPYDNALAENFFSILKTECIYRAKLQTYDEARLIIDEYIHFYNNERIQLKTKLTPLEKRSQYVA